MHALLNRKINVQTWLVFSTLASVFLIIKIGRLGADIFAGYPIVILNAGLLLLLGRLMIHKSHAILIALIAVTSVLAAHFSHTPMTAILAQITGIILMSVCYFSVLLTSGLTVPRWMNLYADVAFYLAVFGIAAFIAQHILHYDPEGDQRLKSIFAEPSLFVYTTLPAMGYYMNAWASERRYGLETLIFLLAYVLADSALGFMGLLLIGAFTFIKRFTIWHLLLGAIVIATLLAGLFFASENFRLRVTDTAVAASSEDIKQTNGSTFAFLSNLYVTGHAVADHPVLGVGIGGYRSAYDRYISELGQVTLESNKNSVGLNSDDANSLFLRVVAELGPIGLIALLGFLIVCAKVDGTPYRQIRNALLPYFFVRMSRFGAYFSMELYFFVGLYLLNFLDYRRQVASAVPGALPAPADPAGARYSPG
ncbi:MAG: O-antigen ligase family protein [Alphaproteobacteria bacterium]|nr:O-antigen ligase family protein [Alphaproteobacteria bacterium]